MADPDIRTPPKRATLKDVAKAAGVSLASASYAINRTGSLGEEMRAHVLKIAEELGYRQNLSARATRTGRTGAIGLVVPDMTNPFFPSLAQAIVHRARQNGYSVFVTDTAGDQQQEGEAIRQLVDRNVDGIVWFPVNDENSIAKLVADIPIIVLDRSVPGFEAVQADYVQGGSLAVEHLLALGHRNVGVVAGPMDVRSMRDRIDGATAALASVGGPTFVVENAFAVELEGTVKEAVEARSATAIFCAADLIAVGVLRHARKMGLAVPEELSIVGFDDIAWSEYCTPALTTIEMPVDEMAIEAVDALLRKLDGEQDGNRRVIFNVKIVVRETTAAVSA
ncbi:LacI family DNA-binding transcriptional regulator [Novosphingobium aquimarinum]|uniref:LacI family DNA-binding transcriptional regulator n=1 Tax=Novosphingobium aquimarinum TaxID=2682494 RepID=UPI0012EB542C|nr:LacI family DNA-binding transcriptional regulator [Novosphingobium aquimarinum]